jgi:hypothetical protein
MKRKHAFAVSPLALCSNTSSSNGDPLMYVTVFRYVLFGVRGERREVRDER